MTDQDREARSAAVTDLLEQAARVIARADALFIGAGAGMGVDSGLPDFRGSTGFWQAYPLYARLKLDFPSMANPAWFRRDPTFAWGFYGHRLNLYRETTPHPGFHILLRWAARMRHGAFVFTSNVDGQFQRAGLSADRIEEVHGSIHHLQCLRDCGVGLLDAAPYSVTIDPETLRAHEPLPTCPGCGGLLRPNILMFGDGGWDSARTEEQSERRAAWREEVGAARLAVVECGAGQAIPTVRYTCEEQGGALIRLNPREPEVPAGQIGIALGALDGLRRIDALL